MVKYQYISVCGQPLRPRCTMCTGLVGTHHTIVRKYPDGDICALCKPCADVVERSETLQRTAELATTMQKTFPELEAWMARHGVWTIPLCHEDLARALGVPLWYPRAIWRDPR